MRIDLFKYLTGHSMRYFQQLPTGSLGNRHDGPLPIIGKPL